MRSLSYNTNQSISYRNNVVDLDEYRSRAAQAGGLPPRPRRKHHSSFGLHVSDLVNMSMVVMTIAAAGMVLAGM
jgi:hypothetical protein